MVTFNPSSISASTLEAKKSASKMLLRTPPPPETPQGFSALAAMNPIASPRPDDNIVAVGVGEKVTRGLATGIEAIKVYVRVKFAPEAIEENHRIPAEIDGIPVDVEQMGTVRRFKTEAQAAMPDPRVRMRPARPGCSIGFIHPQFRMAGTFGALVRRDETYFILSNNHVIADENALPIGSPILQPGTLDGGTAGDAIAKLTEFVRINPSAPNKVDAAIAALSDPGLATNDILFIGPPRGTTPAVVDMTVHKFGRTTSYRVGRVTSVATDVRVAYDVGEVLFEDQIVIRGLDGQPFSAGGDSGSLILERSTNKAVGLLFAGSTSHTIANHIDDVLSELNVGLV